MPVADALFGPLVAIYSEMPSKPKARGAYLVEQRSSIKLLVDTIWEQTIGNILKQNPRNHLEARKFINQAKLDSLPAHDASLLRSLEHALPVHFVMALT